MFCQVNIVIYPAANYILIKTFKCSNREMNTLRNKHTPGRESLAHEAPSHCFHTNRTLPIYDFHTSLLEAPEKLNVYK